MTFRKKPSTSSSGRAIQLVRGDPDCAAFYRWIHAELVAATKHWPPPITKLPSGRTGNLGEFLSYKIARASGLYGKSNGYTIAIMGALTPLQDGAPTGLDTTILHLDPGGDPNKDCLFIMEVKTTGAIKLTYAKALIADYDKLLGKTKVAGSLGQRMNWLQAYLMEVHEFSAEHLERVGNFFQPKAEHCKGIRLLPTLVHDLGSGDMAAVVALDEVARDIEGLGWRKECIEPWSIAITKLTDCLLHLSNNAAFNP
ncbi:hypothetical protein PY254_03350 [Rhodanobacter sp. AS-Z3]|uniref:hypothetical protein n=1 Tax=Rhodanobacter sp. AS-Z3 TaxID=3031330 RepID=UPI00247AAE66|nr:hypothetical protein [Rhodanobacter sp. AS-Z3]WEN15724.1 hypothetical protein PY254_03350 [Rhodanobacter sp. AS-Z3]